MNETKTMYSVDHIADGFSSTLNMPQLSRDDFEFSVVETSDGLSAM